MPGMVRGLAIALLLAWGAVALPDQSRSPAAGSIPRASLETADLPDERDVEWTRARDPVVPPPDWRTLDLPAGPAAHPTHLLLVPAPAPGAKLLLPAAPRSRPLNDSLRI